MESFKPPKNLNLSGNVCENWRKFKQSFAIFMKATGYESKTDEVKCAMLLNIVGEEAVDVFNTFNLTEQQQKNYTEVVHAFEDYCVPKKNIVYERYLFYNRCQKDSESFDQFFTEIRKLVKSCEFGNQENSLLRDRIVLGVRNADVQERLLRVKELTLEKAAEMCRAAELMKSQTKELQEKLNVEKVECNSAGVRKQSNRNNNNQVKQEKSVRKFSEGEEDQPYFCKKCHKKHKIRSCPAFGKSCRRCGKQGHFEIGCRMKKVQEVNDERSTDSPTESDREFYISTVHVRNVNTVSSWQEEIQVENKLVDFKLDTGAEVNIISKGIYNVLGCKNKLESTNLILEAYGGFRLKPIGTVNLKCRHKDKEIMQNFVVVNNNVNPILGLESCIKLNLVNRAQVSSLVNSKESFINRNIDVFEGLGKFKNKCRIILKENCTPVVRPPRRVPLTIRDKLKNKLKELVNRKIISKVEEPGEWVNNLVIVEKADGSLRLCLDPQDLNAAIKRENVLIPTLEELTSRISNKKYYSVLDLKDGFWQIELERESSNLCTFSSPFGCYKFNRLPFGLCMAPEYFQKMNNQNFGDIPGVCIYLDDILVSGETIEEHDSVLRQVVDRARQLGVKFNKNKLQYRVQQVKYLGHCFSMQGVRPDENRVTAIVEMEIPNSKKELQRFLGMINYLRQYLPELAELTAPLRLLLKENTIFQWLPLHTETINKLKQVIINAPVLANFDEKKEITIQCDASQNGLGSCLMQEGKPVYYASRSLNESEKNYAMIEKEMLAIVFAMRKFHNLIYGRNITINTDHKPLLGIMRKKVSEVVSNRLQRMKIKLLKYNLKFIYIPGKEMHVADALSRAFLQNETGIEEKWIKEIVHSISRNISMSENKKRQFVNATMSDPVLTQVKEYFKYGWPHTKKDVKEMVLKYYPFRSNITVENGLVFLDHKIIVPVTLRKHILELLHESHLGIEKTRARARQIVYWPGINTDIEQMINKCSTCERYRNKNVKEPMLLHDIPEIAFSKIASDLMEFKGKDYLVIQDYYTKWLEIIPVRNKTASELVDKFKVIFASYGIPEILVADNMPYGSSEFRQFAKNWNFDIITSSPRYPQSNGQAERAVQTAKKLLKKCDAENKDIYVALLEYRNSPISGLKVSPMQLLMSRMARTKLPIETSLLKPKIEKNIKSQLLQKQLKSKNYYDKNTKSRETFTPGENIVVHKDNEWQTAKIMGKFETPRSYIIKDQNGQTLRRNSVQLRKSSNEYRPLMSSTEHEITETNEDEQTVSDSNVNNKMTEPPQHCTRSGRLIKFPSKFKDFV